MICPVSVAPKSSVWRLSFAGVLWMIFRTSGIKPMSSIRSASSMTKHLDLFQGNVVAPLKIEQPSGRCYDDIDRTDGQLFSLLYVIHAAEHGNDFHGTVPGELAGFLGDLEHQFPGGAQGSVSGACQVFVFPGWGCVISG